MKKPALVGLVVEGNSTNSVVLRLPKLPEQVGPIKSTSLRVAKRLSKFLHTGYAVASYDQLHGAQLILIRVPDAALPRVVKDLCASELDFSSLSFVLCESWLMEDALHPLRRLGASTATLLPIPSVRRRWFVLEGNSPGVRQIRRLVENNDGMVVELRSGRKELYFAAELFATALPIPMFAAAQQALREAGLSGKHLQAVMEEMAAKMFRDFLNASRIRWGGPLNACSSQVAESHLRQLQSSHPTLAKMLDEGVSSARKHLGAKIKQA